MEFIIAMRHLRLDSVLDSEKEKDPTAEMIVSRDRLHAHCSKSKVGKRFAV